MPASQLAAFTCKHCGKSFTDGRGLGGHVRQAHPKPVQKQAAFETPSGDGEIAARVLELWKSGSDPFKVISTLRIHPKVVKEVLREYDDLLNEWKQFKEA